MRRSRELPRGLRGRSRRIIELQDKKGQLAAATLDARGAVGSLAAEDPASQWRAEPAAGRAAPGERPHSLARGQAYRRRRSRDRLALPCAVGVERVCRHLRPSHINAYGMASAFPTTWWYVNEQRVKCLPRLADSSFPMTSWNAINTGALRVYPAISIGASAQGGNPQTPDEKPVGVIYRQPLYRQPLYTVGPPSTGGSPAPIAAKRWKPCVNSWTWPQRRPSRRARPVRRSRSPSLALAAAVGCSSLRPSRPAASHGTGPPRLWWSSGSIPHERPHLLHHRASRAGHGPATLPLGPIRRQHCS
jgi:hypothetical protein